MFVTQQLPFQQILVEGDQQNPWTAILNAEKNLGTNFAKKKLGEVYFSICACKIVPWSQNNPRQTRINRRGIYSIKENAKGDHLKTINNYGNCRNYYRLLNLQSMYCYCNTYNPDALIVQRIVTPLKYSSTNFKQRHSREKCFRFSTSQKYKVTHCLRNENHIAHESHWSGNFWRKLLMTHPARNQPKILCSITQRLGKTGVRFRLDFWLCA